MTDSLRGVSDVVSFTLVFSTIILMIGVVTVTGVGTLEDVQEGTEANVAEQTMRNYASTLSDHRTDGAPRRSSTIKLQGHALQIVDSRLRWSTGGTPAPLETNALVRTTETDENLTYESGALFRGDRSGVVTVDQPPIRCGPDTAHIPIIRIEGQFDLVSDNRVTLESNLVSQQITNRSTNQVTLYTDQTANPAAWNGVLGNSGWDETATNQYQCSGIDRVVVHETTVSVDLVT